MNSLSLNYVEGRWQKKREEQTAALGLAQNWDTAPCHPAGLLWAGHRASEPRFLLGLGDLADQVLRVECGKPETAQTRSGNF